MPPTPKKSIWPFQQKKQIVDFFSFILMSFKHISEKIINTYLPEKNMSRVTANKLFLGWPRGETFRVRIAFGQRHDGTVSGSGTGPLDYGATGPVPDP